VIHSDFRSHNFLIQDDGTLALADSGGSKIDDISAVVSYSTRYARPCADDYDSTELDDLFALGTVIYEIGFGHQLS
jgi:Protein kinase domain.